MYSRASQNVADVSNDAAKQPRHGDASVSARTANRNDSASFVIAKSLERVLYLTEGAIELPTIVNDPLHDFDVLAKMRMQIPTSIRVMEVSDVDDTINLACFFLRGSTVVKAGWACRQAGWARLAGPGWLGQAGWARQAGLGWSNTSILIFCSKIQGLA